MATRWQCPECGWSKPTLPRYETRPTKAAKTWQRDVERASSLLVGELMPWQRKVNRLRTELRPDGRPRWKLGVVAVPRQSGKTILSRASIAARSQRGRNLEMYGTSLTRTQAAEHAVKLGHRLEEAGAREQALDRPDRRRLAMVPSQVLKGAGKEAVLWGNGSTYRPIAPNESGGHGESIDDMLIDEGWAVESVLLGGVMPATIARPQSQIIVISTMGYFDSAAWNGLVDEGRSSVEDPDSTMFYVEYSAGADDDVWDESKWHLWMPALGRSANPETRVTHEGIRLAIKTMLADPDQGPNEVVRAFGNRIVKSKVLVFPSEWVNKSWRIIQPSPIVCLGVDVNESPEGAAVSAGHLTPEGQIAVRLLEWRSGSPSWVPGYIAEIVKERVVQAIWADFGGPARQLRRDLIQLSESTQTALGERSVVDFGADCMTFYDALRREAVVLAKAPPLEESFQGAARKSVGDVWLVSRRLMSVDASPLIATIIAHSAAAEAAVHPPVSSFVL